MKFKSKARFKTLSLILVINKLFLKKLKMKGNKRI